MLGWRLTLGPVLIALVVGIFALDARLGAAAPGLGVLAVLLAVRAAWELTNLLQASTQPPAFSLTAACSAAVVAANWLPQAGGGAAATGVAALGPAMLALALAVTVLLFNRVLRYREPGGNLEALGAELLIVCYVGVLLSLTAQLRWVAGADWGYLPLGSVIVVTKCGDTAAYTFGHLFGRTKLAPRLSPGKTWAGAWGALAGGTAGSVAWFHWGAGLLATGRPEIAWYWSAIFGAIIAVVGLVGDLCESLIKRDVGRKDAAPLLPGFGGLLDLLDSILFAGPVAYGLWLILPWCSYS